MTAHIFEWPVGWAFGVEYWGSLIWHFSSQINQIFQLYYILNYLLVEEITQHTFVFWVWLCPGIAMAAWMCVSHSHDVIMARPPQYYN